MAKAPTKAQKAAAAAAAAQQQQGQQAHAPSFDFDLTLLSQVIQATNSAEGYGWFAHTQPLEKLAELGYIEVGAQDETTKNFAVRATPQAVEAEKNAHAAIQAAQAAQVQQPQTAQPQGGFGGGGFGAATQQPQGGGFNAAALQQPQTTNTAAAQPQGTVAASNATSFKVVTSGLQIPAAKRFGKSVTYPFDALQIGHGFFVPATNERPKPWKSMASTVAGATARYAVLDGQEPNPDAPGTMRDKYKKTRIFVLRNLPDGAAAGFGAEFKGVAGAGVYRTA